MLSFSGSHEFIKMRPEIARLLRVYHQEAAAFEISVFEAISNALRYGEGGAEKARVDVIIVKSEQRLYVRVKSNNQGFNVERELTRLASLLLRGDYWQAIISAVRGRGLILMAEGCQKIYFNRAGNDVLLITNSKIVRPQPLTAKIRVLNV